MPPDTQVNLAPRSQSETDRALRASELSYRRLFETAKDGILILDAGTGRISDANPFLIELLGFSRAEMLGKTVGELSPFKDLWANKAMLERLKRDNYVRYDDLPLETKDGRQIAVEFVSNVYRAGESDVIQCNVRDISARKLAEQRMNLLDTCIANLNDIVLITEADPIDEPGPRIVFVNEAFERLTGYTSAEAIGRSPRFLQGEKTDRRVLTEIRDALLERKAIRRQILNYGKDGAEYWLDMDIVPVFGRDGKCTHFAAIQRDITEQKKIDDQLLWKTAFFEAQVNSSLDGIIVVDKEGKKVIQNRKMIELWKPPPDIADEVDHRLRLEWITTQVKDSRQFAEKVAYLYAHPLEVSRDELELVDGRHFDRYSAPVQGADGRIFGRIWSYRDVTERIKLEHQFLRAQRMESVGTLAGGIAHDLNNILAPILMSIEILKGLTDNPSATSILGTIEISAKRGADIVRQVLSFARGIEGQRIEIQAKHLLDDLESIIMGTFPKDIRTNFSIAKETWTILGDPTQVHQVLLNLCVNARDAMPNGGTLAIGFENAILDEQYVAMNIQAKAGRYVKISVTDSGMGIPPEIVGKIFEPFFTTKELNKGTGLGLSTVMAIVKSHEGLINVYSEPGRGTTFNIYLPAMDMSPGARKELLETTSVPRGNGETILVVDDESSILIITRQTLEAFGYRVLTSGDGAEAVGVFAERKGEIALVLTDMSMPVMDGSATVRALTKINPAVKVIAASGLEDNGAALKLQVSNVKCFLTKPYTAATLLRAVRKVLDQIG